MTSRTEDSYESLYNKLTESLVSTHGELMTGEALYQSLGYQDSGAFRQARYRKQLAVRTFNVAHRKGSFALTRDVARWMVKSHRTAEEVSI